MRRASLVDTPLESCAAVIQAIDRSRRFDESRAKVAGRFVGADVVLDLPEQLVHAN